MLVNAVHREGSNLAIESGKLAAETYLKAKRAGDFSAKSLSAYQKKLGVKLGVVPGTELLEATQAAEENGIPVSLCDRDVRVTLRRAWRSTPFWKKTLLLSRGV